MNKKTWETCWYSRFYYLARSTTSGVRVLVACVKGIFSLGKGMQSCLIFANFIPWESCKHCSVTLRPCPFNSTNKHETKKPKTKPSVTFLLKWCSYMLMFPLKNLGGFSLMTHWLCTLFLRPIHAIPASRHSQSFPASFKSPDCSCDQPPACTAAARLLISSPGYIEGI